MDHPAKKRRLAPAPARPAQHIPVIQAPQVQQIAGAPATSQLTSDQITTASVDMIEPAGSQQVQATEVPPSKAKIGRRRAIPKPPDAKIFRGHPLADPYPWSMVNAPCAGFIGPLKPVIVMDPRQRRLQRTPLGRLTIVTLINGQRLCDAREAIALSDGRIFKGYESIEGIDITSTRNAINRKWGDTLHYIPAIYIKFAKTNTIFPFVDDKGFMQILRRGEGERCKELKDEFYNMVISVLGRDMVMYSRMQERIHIQNQRKDPCQVEDAIFMSGVNSRKTNTF